MRKYILCILLVGLSISTVYANNFTASYYTVKSAQREGTSGVWTASGERYDENAMTCAMRTREWNQRWKVCNLNNGKCIEVRNNDYGPNKKLHDSGRIVDLSKGAFLKIADLDKGIINVSVEKIK